MDDRSAEVVLLGCLVQYSDYKPALLSYGRLAARMVRNKCSLACFRLEPQQLRVVFHVLDHISKEFYLLDGVLGVFRTNAVSEQSLVLLVARCLLPVCESVSRLGG